MFLRKIVLVICGIGFVISLNGFQMSTAPVNKEAAFAKVANAYFQSVLDELGAVPGVSIAVVKDDKPVYVKGFGVGNLDQKTKVDENTIFYIASCTKSFTALLAMHLDEKGIIKLDDPITKYLPEVKFDAKLEANKITIRDLLRHTSGLDNGAITYRLAYSGDHTLKKLIELLDYTEPNKAGRGNYQYTNFGYNLYGIIVDKITGKPWQDWLKEVIFQPAVMRHTTAYMSNVQKNKWDMAMPHMGLIGKPIEQVYLVKNDKNMQSAGGLVTTAADAARWLELQLNEGKLDGKQIFPAEMIRATHEKLAKTNGEGFDGFERNYYGLGWQIGAFNKHPNIHHFGGYPGYLTHISFDPEAKIGVAIMTNEGYWGDNVMNLFAEYTYDWWYGTADFDQKYAQKKQELIDHCTKTSQRIEQGIAERAKRSWQLDQPFPAYAGTYVSDLMGTVHVKGDKDKMAVTMGNLAAIATPYTDKNSIRVELVPGQGEVIQFEMKDGKVVGAKNGEVFFKKVK